MSESLQPRQPLGALSVGNVVSAGLRIYRDRFKSYYVLALQGSLWSLIPVYGWAKGAAIFAMISRLAYGEVIERPESIPEARRQVNPLLWNFLLAGILVGLILIGVLFGFGLVAGLVFGVLGTLFQQNSVAIALLILLGLVVFLAFLVGYTWLFSRLSIVELPIAIESQRDPAAAIGRSWNLTKGYVWQLILIFSVAFLIIIPIYSIAIVLSLAVTVLTRSLLQNSPVAAEIVNYILSNLVSIPIGAIFIPFWQSIKGVIYYDLRARKEGIDLQIRDT
ncbi:MAG: DUF975 domain-containing protein [Hydrococcus sp. C42_A2020_068]|uniref:hypothetical protein n=1 Tax=Pleurocapsa sp. PCC 7327 TaxID=118163 RepID=UPI00029F9D73|nr:hypothetical protein [Pleurocapsa sp. PCC 7327]AFY76607.1 hypothetical protein Ple7327_1206 [Pleurocapsa sp. PCC 7327]MBF2021645.1 DUF975 domain-containing protein [Hydrococcus sp. C42_A2020_068]